jgi:predicted transcriptional regulator
MASGLRNPTVKVTEEQKLQNQINKLNDKLTGFNGPDARVKKFAEGTAEYKAAAAEAIKLRNDIQTLEVKLAQSKITTVQSAYQRALDSGNTDEANRLSEELGALNATINNPSDPKVSGPQYVEGDEFGNTIRKAGLIVDTDETGKSVVRSSMEGYAANGSEHFVWGSKGGFKSKLPGFSSTVEDTKVEIGASYNEVEKKILQDANTKPGGMQGLFDRLYKAGLIKKQTYDTKAIETSDFTAGLMYALREYSKKTTRDYEISGIKTPVSFDDYLDKQFTPAGPDVKYNSVTTTRDTAASDLDRFFMNYLGSGASKEQHDEYYKQLRALEKKATKVTTTTESSQNVAGEYIDDLDKADLMRKVAGKALDGSNIDTILKGGAGAAQDVNSVISKARQYGVKLSNEDALDYVANELRLGQKDLNKVNAKILSIAKSTYGNLSDSLSDEVNLKDLSANYIYNMAEVLELNPKDIDALDPTVQTALKNNGNKGTMNLTDFDRMLRNDPRWAKTKNAKEEASKYAYEVLRDFGLMA